MPEWLATVVTGVACTLLGYVLGVRRERRAEKRAERAERRARRAEKRDVERLEREREQTADQEAEEKDYGEFLDEVDAHFEDGGRSFPVESDDRLLAQRAVDDGLFDPEWRRGKLILRRRNAT